MTQEQIEQGSIEKLGRISPTFYVGAEWMQERMIEKALRAYCNACGVKQRIANPNDCEKNCLMFEAFRKAIKIETI